VQALSGTQVGSNFSQQILPTHTFKHPPKDLDVLFVPGGPGSMVLELDDAIAYIRHVYPSLQYIFSVCTGSTLLARAGVLDGKNATTNKSGSGRPRRARRRTGFLDVGSSTVRVSPSACIRDD
jgi:putative intracellular protease/amidase